LPEYLLLRDALYLLQGISGKYIRFEDADAEEMKALIFDEDSVSPLPNLFAPIDKRTANMFIRNILSQNPLES